MRLTTSICIFQLNTCGYSSYVTSSLTRGRVCRLQLLLGLASAVILRSEPRGTLGHILLSQIRVSPNLEASPRIYIPQEHGGLVIPSGTRFPFRRLLRSQGSGGGISTSRPYGILIATAMAMLITSWHGPRIKHRVFYLLPWNRACLRSRYLPVDVV
jgi:hypothetical protein